MTSIQTNLNNEQIPFNHCKCIKSDSNYYLVISNKYKLHNMYKIQKVGTTLVFHPIIERGILKEGV